MVQMTWDPATGIYRPGVHQGVLYLDSGAYAWNGLISVTEEDNSVIDTTLHYDGIRHRLAQDTGNYSSIVEAYTYPEAFNEYDGLESYSAHQSRKRFGMSYRIGEGDNYEIHLVYNALVSPGGDTHKTIQESVDPNVFSWRLDTHGIDLTWTKSASHLVVVANEAHPDPLATLEGYIYGTASSNPFLPDPSTVIALFERYTDLTVTYNGDGTFTAEGPQYMIEEFIEAGMVEVENPNAFDVYDGVYIMRSHWEGG